MGLRFHLRGSCVFGCDRFFPEGQGAKTEKFIFVEGWPVNLIDCVWKMSVDKFSTKEFLMKRGTNSDISHNPFHVSLRNVRVKTFDRSDQLIDVIGSSDELFDNHP